MNCSRSSLVAVAAILLVPPPRTLNAQVRLTRADSSLIARVLLAEDRRDSTDRALAQALAHADARVRALAQRALGRIRDPRFAARDSTHLLPAPPVWPEPAWRLRFRALTAKRDDCGALRDALTDSAWAVRLRVADLARVSCAGDDVLASTFRTWVDALPGDASRRARGGVSWHAAAHGLVALARLRPTDARTRARRLAAHSQWQVRMYAARAAAELVDTATLRILALDRDGNVREASIDALSRLTGHADDSLYVASLAFPGAQAARAAAIALKGSPRPDLPTLASAAFERWVARRNASERDVRVALLDAANRPASDDRPPATRVPLPPRIVSLALGADVRLRVAMSPASGGGSFIVRLRGDVAPMMSARVLELARDHYYDHGVWHRVEPDFVIQGGARGTNEYVGGAQYFRDELGTVPHARGTVGMSTRGHDTGDAQWFVNLKDNLRLGRDYTVFAEVLDGIDVVDGILEGDVVTSIREVSARGAGRAGRPEGRSSRGTAAPGR